MGTNVLPSDGRRVIVDSRTDWSSVLVIVSFLASLGLVTFVLFFVLLVFLPPIFAVLVSMVLAAGGLSLIGRVVEATRRWHPAELIVDTEYFELGSTHRVHFRYRPKKISDIPAAEIRLTLECIETVTYSVGTDTRTDKATVVSVPMVATGRGTEHGFEVAADLHIPVTAGGPTLDLSSNNIDWRLAVSTHGDNKLPARVAHFPILVVPSLFKRIEDDVRSYPEDSRPSPSDINDRDV